mmetsp:Transcript_51472/g.95213  ORF Transcript_51472/g.95213 Transcript_51472/m.95213 type:complete len:162 (+) Transcript_51472:3-488(+)
MSCALGGAPGGATATMRQCAIGTGSTVIVDLWFMFAEHLFHGWPPAEVRSVLAKTALQMAVLQPTICSYYVGFKKALEGQLSTLARTLRDSLLQLTVAGWILWGPTAALQYAVVPPRYRALVNNLVGFVYTTYLILKTSSVKPTKALPAEEEEASKKAKSA